MTLTLIAVKIFFRKEIQYIFLNLSKININNKGNINVKSIFKQSFSLYEITYVMNGFMFINDYE